MSPLAIGKSIFITSICNVLRVRQIYFIRQIWFIIIRTYYG